MIKGKCFTLLLEPERVKYNKFISLNSHFIYSSAIYNNKAFQDKPFYTALKPHQQR